MNTTSTAAAFRQAEKLIAARNQLSPAAQTDINFKEAQARLMNANAALIEAELNPPRVVIIPRGESELHDALERHERELLHLLSMPKYRGNVCINHRIADIRETSMHINMQVDTSPLKYDVYEL